MREEAIPQPSIGDGACDAEDYSTMTVSVLCLSHTLCSSSSRRKDFVTCVKEALTRPPHWDDKGVALG